MKIFKRWTVIFIILSLSLLYIPPHKVKAAVSLGENYTKVCANDFYELYLDETTADFAVVSKKTGFVLYSTPPDKENDGFAKSVNKQSLYSQITVEYFERSTRKQKNFVSSYAESIKKGNFEIERLKNGFKVIYTFEKGGFVIPLKIELLEDSFIAEVELNEIQEDLDEFRITSISVLPFMMSSNQDDKGYFVIPDGSGSLMYFNNGRKFADLIQCKIYGDNDVKAYKQAVKDNTEDINLPVFGMSKNSSGAIGIIESGDVNATISGSVSGKITSYNNLYVKFQIRDTDTLVLGNPETLNFKEYNELYEEMPDYDTLRIKYYLLDNGNDYVAMANKYREYLIKENKLEQKSQKEYPFMLNVYGGVKKRDTFLGIPITKIVSLTKYDDAVSMMETLKSSGIEDIILRYNRWNKNDINYKLSGNIKFTSKVGSKRDLSKLLEYVKQEDIQFYAETDYWKMGENSYNFFTIRKNVAYDLNEKPSEQFYQKLSVFDKNDSKPSWYLLAPRNWLGVLEDNIKSLKKNNIPGVSINLSGDTLYQDYSDNSKGSRYYAKVQIENIVNELRNNDIKVMGRAANGYGANMVDMITDVPFNSTGYLMTDEDIPFYQIVYHGYVPMATEPINFFANQRDAFLKAVETGMILQYTFVYEDTEVLRDTELDFLYAANWKGLRQKAIDQYLEAAEVMKKIMDQKIISHKKLAEGVYETGYENGIKIVVNYNDEKYKAGEYEVPAKGFIYFGGDK